MELAVNLETVGIAQIRKELVLRVNFLNYGNNNF